LEGFRIVFPGHKQIRTEGFEVEEAGEGEVLIETEATLISTGTELTALTGDFPKDSAWSRYIKYPFMPGARSVNVKLYILPYTLHIVGDVCEREKQGHGEVADGYPQRS